MKQFLKYSLALVIIVFFGCQENEFTPAESGLPKPFSKRYRALTTHYWRLAEIWEDTSLYAKIHPELIPLPTSKNIITFVDSCDYYKSTKYDVSGNEYNVVRPNCAFCFQCGGCIGPQPCLLEGDTWSLTNKDQSFNKPSDTSKVIMLTDDVFKYSKYFVYNYTKSLVRVYVRKPHIY